MILLRKLHFWSRSAATVTCDHEGCKKEGSADLVCQPAGGFAIKFPGKGLWFAQMDPRNPGAPFKTYCLPDHKPVIERANGPIPRNGAEVAREAKRIIDVVKR